MARRSRSLLEAAWPCAVSCWRPAPRRRAWTRHFARAAAAPTRSRDCRGARSGARARRTAHERDACSKRLRLQSRALRATEAATQPEKSGARASSCELLGDAQQGAARAGIALDLLLCGPRLATDEPQPGRSHGRRQDRQRCELRIELGFALQEALHEPIFEGVEADHGEA